MYKKERTDVHQTVAVLSTRIKEPNETDLEQFGYNDKVFEWEKEKVPYYEC